MLKYRFLALLLFVPLGCFRGPSEPLPLKHVSTGKTPELLALYEAWFGQPNHISISYSSADPKVIENQIKQAKKRGIAGFVVDWFGDRDAVVQRNYPLVQELAAKQHFKVAMMYDEKDAEVGATDEVIADLTHFRDSYLSASATGHDAYLTYDGRPVIFVFPGSGNKTDWSEVRKSVDQWNPAPLLIQENTPGRYADAFDGFYPWVNPGAKGWAADGSNWGDDYLTNFYRTLDQKYPDKIIVGGAWASFDDSKASWGLNRHINARCGQTFWDTFAFWRPFVPTGQVIPFMLIETWNDYEEGTAVEPGVPSCDDGKKNENLGKAQKDIVKGKNQNN